MTRKKRSLDLLYLGWLPGLSYIMFVKCTSMRRRSEMLLSLCASGLLWKCSHLSCSCFAAYTELTQRSQWAERDYL